MENKKKISKKYLERPSPAVSAADYEGKRKKGNDGNWWISTQNSKNIYTWKKYELKGGKKNKKTQKKKTQKKKKLVKNK
jgi:hypothetical protein